MGAVFHRLVSHQPKHWECTLYDLNALFDKINCPGTGELEYLNLTKGNQPNINHYAEALISENKLNEK